MATPWKDAIRKAASQHPRGIAGVAAQIGMPRSALSMLLSDSYPADPAAQLSRVLRWLGQSFVHCPHLAIQIGDGDCRSHRNRPQPSGNAPALRHWVACQDCALGQALAAQAESRAA